MLLIYYIVCVLYCFYKLITKYQKNYNDGMIGLSPGLDAIMVVIMAGILAPIDISLTWIRMVKEAEQARINQSKIDIDLTEDDIH
jgi:uncharacterized membrane protein